VGPGGGCGLEVEDGRVLGAAVPPACCEAVEAEPLVDAAGVLAAFAGRAAVLEAVLLPACVWLAAAEACWPAGLPVGGAADGFAPGVAVGRPEGTLDPALARCALHTGQARKCSD